MSYKPRFAFNQKALRACEACVFDTGAHTCEISPVAMAPINAQVASQLKTGQITTISPTSVLAYELGWGEATKDASKSVYGFTYTFDGSNWTLETTQRAANPVQRETKEAEAKV